MDYLGLWVCCLTAHTVKECMIQYMLEYIDFKKILLILNVFYIICFNYCNNYTIKVSCHLFVQDGNTPLILAAVNGHNEAVEILLLHGAGVDMKNVVSTLYSYFKNCNKMKALKCKPSA